MLARNPMRMDYQIKYEEIVASYNAEKDRTSIEDTFARLVQLVNSLNEEQKRAAREGLNENELAIFDRLQKAGLNKTERETVKQASKELLASLQARLSAIDRFWEKEPGLYDPSHPAVHGRGEEPYRRQRLRPRLAAGHAR